MEIKSGISIAMCTYNGARFLREQLDSFSCQTRLPDEVVICDDGSTDETLAILEDWAKTVPFKVQIVKNDRNLGFAKNFEKAIGLCENDILFLADQDDIWLPEKIERMAKVMETSPQLVLLYGNALFFSEKDPIGTNLLRNTQKRFPYYNSAFQTRNTIRNPFPTGCLAAVRKSFLTQIMPIPEGWGHDTWFYTLARDFGEILTLNDILVRYRRHEGTVTDRKYNPEAADEIQKNNYRAWVPYFQLVLNKTLYIQKWLLSQTQTPSIRAHLRKLAREIQYFENRKKIQENCFNLKPLCENILKGWYFRHPQPVRSLLFDVKEGIQNRLKKDRSYE